MIDNFPRHISIIGLGLIGGSLGLALQASPLDIVVTGWDAHAASLEQALHTGAIEGAASSLAEGVSHSDLIIIATPVLAVRNVLEQIAPHLKPGAIVTDVASTKAQAVTWAQELLPSTTAFVGGHPMAGSEQHGIQNARADLFKGAMYCLTPVETTPRQVVALLKRLIEQIGAKPLQLSPETHDAYVAAVSHLPFVLSTALVRLTSGDPHWPEMRQLAATGYRDVTRLASGDPIMHRDICLTNTEAVRSRLLEMSRLLEEVATHMNDMVYLQTLFETARQERDVWLREREKR
jgi:prephenate dehydrogenase